MKKVHDKILDWAEVAWITLRSRDTTRKTNVEASGRSR
jgi:hypothetical protein